MAAKSIGDLINSNSEWAKNCVEIMDSMLAKFPGLYQWSPDDVDPEELYDHIYGELKKRDISGTSDWHMSDPTMENMLRQVDFLKLGDIRLKSAQRAVVFIQEATSVAEVITSVGATCSGSSDSESAEFNAGIVESAFSAFMITVQQEMTNSFTKLTSFRSATTRNLAAYHAVMSDDTVIEVTFLL